MAKYVSQEPVPATDNAFFNELRQFHESRGTRFRRVPTLNGRSVDLELLYHEVISLGGWRKVNDTQRWDTILQKVNIPRSCANAALALKQFYIRYLDHYEKVNFLGEDPDDDAIDCLDHPSRKTQPLAYLVPLTYNHHQHDISETLRSQYGLSTDFSSASDYDKLLLSLQSGLPNEVDFALNVVTLLSNEGRHTLRLNKNPKLVDVLVSHAGVWTESNKNLKELLERQWQKMEGRQMARFWEEIVDDRELRDFYISGQKGKAIADDADEETFNLRYDLGARVSEGQRIQQVATILCNLSFEEGNASVIASSSTCLKFLFLCINAKWSRLRQLALETLGNVASEINLEPINCVNTQVMFRTLTRSLASSDRFLVIRGLEILTGLCRVEGNEDIIIRSLGRKIYEQICNLLTIHDIMVLIYTLECLYHLTDLGQDTCNNIVCIHKVIEILVNLITVEAQSYGPSACISMKVIETAPPVQPATVAPITQRPQPAPSPSTPRQATTAATTAVHGYQEADNDTFAYNWLKAYYEWHAGHAMSQNELYVDYQTTCNKLGKKGLVPPSQLLNLLKSLYPQLKSRQEGVRSEVQLEGIRRRAVPLPVSIYMPARTNIVTATNSKLSGSVGSRSNVVPCVLVASSSSPILKAQLSAPPRGGSSSGATGTTGSASNNHPHLQQALLGRSQPSATKPTAATPPASGGSNKAVPPIKDSSSNLIKSLLANKVNQNMMLKQQQQSSNVVGNSVTTADPLSGATVTTSTSPVKSGRSPTSVTSPPNAKKGKESVVTTPVRPRSPKSRINGATRTLQMEDPRMFQVCAHVEQAKNLVDTNEFHEARIERIENHLLPRGDSSVPDAKRRLIADAETTDISSVSNDSDEPTLDKLLRGNSSSVRLLQNGVLTSAQNGNRSEPDSPKFATMEAIGFGGESPVRRKGVLADLLEGKVAKDALLTMNGIVDRSERVPQSTGTTVGAATVPLNNVSTGAVLNRPKAVVSNNVVFARKSTVPHTNGDLTALSGSLTNPTTTSTANSAGVLTAKTVKVILPASVVTTAVSVASGVTSSTSMNPNGEKVVTATLLADWSNLPSASKVIVPTKSAGESEELIGFPRVSMEQLQQLRQQVVTVGGSAVVTQPGKRPLLPATVLEISGHEAKRTRVEGKLPMLAPKPPSSSSSVSSSSSTNVTSEERPVTSTATSILSASEVQQQVSAALQGSFTDKSSASSSDASPASVPTRTTVAVVVMTLTDSSTVVRSPAAMTVLSSSPPTTDAVTTTSKTFCTTSTATVVSAAKGSEIVNSRTSKSDAKMDYVCEWKDCMKAFRSPMAVFVHACKCHVPEGSSTASCLWESCDQMTRQRLSLMTHLQDRHCNDNMLRLQATRRQQLAQMGSSTIPPPAPPPPHPGYAPNAAFQAIKRHALEFVAQKEQQGADEKEGPVTKSIRLTAALILRNLIMYSALARSMVRKYEPNLSMVAMSNVESSRTVAQCLWELNRKHDVRVR